MNILGGVMTLRPMLMQPLSVIRILLFEHQGTDSETNNCK
jgi:hypothetical protein